VPRELLRIDERPQEAEAARRPRQHRCGRARERLGPAERRPVEALDAQPPGAHANGLPSAHPEQCEVQHGNDEQEDAVGGIARGDCDAAGE
jgi:hypothetical protein